MKARHELACSIPKTPSRTSRREGGRNRDLTELTKQLVLLLKTLEMTFIPKWLPRNKNARADALSKEWACKRDLRRDLHYALAARFGQEVVVTAPEFTKIHTWRGTREAARQCWFIQSGKANRGGRRWPDGGSNT